MADPIVVLHVTDIPFLNAAAIVTRQRLESIGFKVILKAMDWSTNLIVRARKEPPDKGGWNLLAYVVDRHATSSIPLSTSASAARAQRAWFGWPDIPQLEKLVTDWVRATDQTKRKQLADEVQKVALSEVTYVPWGEWVQPTAFRKNVRDSSSSQRRFSGTCESLEVKSPRVETVHAAITQRRVY